MLGIPRQGEFLIEMLATKYALSLRRDKNKGHSLGTKVGRKGEGQSLKKSENKRMIPNLVSHKTHLL